jgi:hypothetical protein
MLKENLEQVCVRPPSSFTELYDTVLRAIYITYVPLQYPRAKVGENAVAHELGNQLNYAGGHAIG